MVALLCPLCSQPRFDNLDALRHQLVHAATQNISCPICNDVLCGLDKLTIHLFGHTVQEEAKKQTSATVIEEIATPNEDVAYNFEGQSTKSEEEDKIKESCTVNLEDLSFLTSWENDLKYRQKSHEEIRAEMTSISNDSNQSDSNKPDNTELSEYMSNLLNKKLPISNFIFCENPSDEIKPEITINNEQGNLSPFVTNMSDTSVTNCQPCNLTFQNESFLQLHKDLIHSKPELIPKCENVDQSFVFPASQEGDVSLKNEDNNFSCHVCLKTFKMKGSLMLHYRVAHYGLNLPVNVVPDNPGSPPQDDKNYQCTICPKAFRKEQHLSQHVKTHEGKQWQCETCNKLFTTKYFLKKHQRLHTGEMPYCCSTCGKTFTFQQSYHKHLLYHSDDKPHGCMECGRSFKELSTLHNHQRIHSGEKPFACQTCGKCFRQRVSYIVHQRIHTGVLPYQCTACKKKFRYKVSQRSHKCTAHPPGVVVKQTSDLIQRILEHRNTILQSSSQ